MKRVSVCRLASAGLLAVLLLSGFGCGRRSSAEKAAQEQRVLAEINQAFALADEAFSGGRTNEALSLIDSAFRNPAFSGHRPQILDVHLQTLLRLGRIGEARQRALAASSDPVLAACACGAIYQFYREAGDVAGALAWAEALAANPTLAPDLRAQVFSWSVVDRIALHQDEEAVAVLGKALQTVKPAEGLLLTRRAIDAFLAAGKPAKTEQILALAAGLKVSAMEIKRLTVVTQMRVAAACGNWAVLPRDLSAAVGV